MMNEVIKTHHEFYNMSRCIVRDPLRHEVDIVLRHFPRGKSLGWNNLENKVSKQYFNNLKGPQLCVSKCGGYGCMLQAWKVGLIKLVPKITSTEPFYQYMYFFDGELYKIFTKVLENTLQK